MSKKNAATTRNERAAAAVREQERQEQRRRMTMIGVVVLVLVVVVIGGTLWMRANDPVDDVAAPPAGSSEHGVAIGDPEAPHQVVVYEDFLCPFCGEFEEATRDDFARLADEGKVYVEYRPYNLLQQWDYSERATNAFAVVLDAEGPEAAKELHDLLFENQPEEGGDYPDDDQLVAWAVEAGASEDEVRPAIEGLEQEEWVDAATQAAQDAGVPGTPTILLDGEVYQEGSTMSEVADSLVETLE